MGQIIAIGLGGAFGSIFRYLLSRIVQTSSGSSFPFGVLTVNVLGCFLMGVLVVLFLDRLSIDAVWRSTILIGFLGGFTTFSSFSIDTINLLQSGAQWQALVYVSASVIFCLTATWLGIILGRVI